MSEQAGGGGPQMSQSGAMPSGPEMETWKAPPEDAPASPDSEESVQEQAEGLADQVDNQ
jgi:hypothetical protein